MACYCSNFNIFPFKAPSPPTIQPYDGKTVIKEGGEKILTCLATGSPKPNVTWYRDGKQLKITDYKNDPKSCENILYEVYEEGDVSALHTTYTTGVLEIRKTLYPRDDGEFKCVASNGNLPSAELTIDLDVQGMSGKYFVAISKDLIKQFKTYISEKRRRFEVILVSFSSQTGSMFKWS